MLSKILSSFRRKEKLKISGEIVADLDALLVEPVAFILHGKQHIIRPLTTEQFLLYTSNLTEVYSLRGNNSLTADQLIDKYHSLMHSVCSSIKRKDIEDMTQQQVGALFELIVQTVTGQAQVDKKKSHQLTSN